MRVETNKLTPTLTNDLQTSKLKPSQPPESAISGQNGQGNASDALVALRSELSEKFGAAQVNFGKKPETERVPTGVRWLDEITGGGLEKGNLYEISASAGPATGGGLFVVHWLRHAAKNRQRLVLIDAADSFDPTSTGETLCRSLLWARCRNVEESIRVADLILRDGNLPWIAFDLQFCPEKDLLRIPGSSWYRLRGLVEESGVICVALTPKPILKGAAARFELYSRFSLQDCERPESEWADAFTALRSADYRNRTSQSESEPIRIAS